MDRRAVIAQRFPAGSVRRRIEELGPQLFVSAIAEAQEEVVLQQRHGAEARHDADATQIDGAHRAGGLIAADRYATDLYARPMQQRDEHAEERVAVACVVDA